MIKVLYVLDGTMSYGGIESFIMNILRNIDKEKVHIDIVQCGNGIGVYDDEILRLGSSIYYIPYKSNNLFGYLGGLRKIIQKNKYDIVHAMSDGTDGIVSFIATLEKVKTRISHSHNTRLLKTNLFHKIVFAINKTMIKFFSTDFMACSNKAGEWLFGSEHFYVIHNAIDSDKYAFDDNIRKKIRDKYKINEDECLVGNAARFDYQKNHKFLIDVFKNVAKNKKIKLMLVGKGLYEKNIVKQIDEYNLSDKVIIVNPSENIHTYYNAFDTFVLPSKFEGLPLVMIESQYNGLNTIVSDTITGEADISNGTLVSYLPLRENVWEEELNTLRCRATSDLNNNSIDKDGFYNIKREADRLLKIYVRLYEKQFKAY